MRKRKSHIRTISYQASIRQVELISKSLAFTVSLAYANGRKKAVGECPQVEFIIKKGR